MIDYHSTDLIKSNYSYDKALRLNPERKSDFTVENVMRNTLIHKIAKFQSIFDSVDFKLNAIKKIQR